MEYFATSKGKWYKLNSSFLFRKREGDRDRRLIYTCRMSGRQSKVIV